MLVCKCRPANGEYAIDMVRQKGVQKLYITSQSIFHTDKKTHKHNTHSGFPMKKSYNANYMYTLN